MISLTWMCDSANALCYVRVFAFAFIWKFTFLMILLIFSSLHSFCLILFSLLVIFICFVSLILPCFFLSISYSFDEYNCWIIFLCEKTSTSKRVIPFRFVFLFFSFHLSYSVHLDECVFFLHRHNLYYRPWNSARIFLNAFNDGIFRFLVLKMMRDFLARFTNF